MLSQFSYPIICSEKYIKTVNFYEDHFEFVPEFEEANFVILKRKDRDDIYLAIIDTNHKGIPDRYRKSVSGMILNYPVKDTRAAYQQYYWEGLNIVSEPEVSSCARKHFFVEDPNGILIDIAEDVEIEKTNILETLSNIRQQRVSV